ncbi:MULTISPECIES: hypothetical protein [unclassified Pseudoalteromonas]|uniref:hypothetical protein n=1 Tax=unclassified Pseudoalteromonas TaxID=194690 RepID=UPI000ACB1B71|nr:MULTISPECIES: hypothetical protein [unclassified Pseudoalteromonas]
MKNKVGIIKNPLSVIAIFAGIAEISGTMVLPHINPANQALFIWFLMLFPFTLVILFFITLNWNYKVLYAPSDFKDENNFVNLQQASTSEVLLKIEDELIHLANESVSIDIERTQEDNRVQDHFTDTIHSLDNQLTYNTISSKADRALQSDILKRINNQRMKEARLLEKQLITKVQNDFNSIIQRDIKIESQNSKFIFDGVIQNGQMLTVFEVKRINLNTFNGSYLNRLMDNYKTFYAGLTENQQSTFSMIFIVATDDDMIEVNERIDKLFSIIDFKLEVKTYSIDSLINTNLKKAS